MASEPRVDVVGRVAFGLVAKRVDLLLIFVSVSILALQFALCAADGPMWSVVIVIVGLRWIHLAEHIDAARIEGAQDGPLLRLVGHALVEVEEVIAGFLTRRG